MINLKQNIADIKRFKEILDIVFEEGFSVILESTKLKKFLPLNKKIKKDKKVEESNEVRLRRTFERLGPTFVKFGQLLSIRPDFIPKNYIKELEKLQDSVGAFSFSEAKKIIERSTGKKIEQVFKKIDEKPIASASMAQVHKAILKNGDVVAVKVRRPNIKNTIQKDMEIMFFIAKLLEKHVKGIKKFRPVGIVEEFSEWTKRELDFNIEAENIRNFYKNFKDSKTTKIPKIYNEFCNEELIVMEFMDGIELNKIDKKKLKGIDIKKALKNGFYSVLEQVFVYGLFHADAHPSNIFVLKENKVGFVDFGIVGRFDENLKDKAIDLFSGMSEGNSEKVTETLLELGAIDEECDIEKFKRRIADAIYPLGNNSLKDIKISKVLEDVLDTALEFGVKMPLEFALFAKAIVTIEGTALKYHPSFRFGESVVPFLEDIMISRYEPKRLVRNGINKLSVFRKIMEKIPKQTTRVLDKLEKGRIKIEMRDTDIERLSIELDKSSNRLTYGMIIAALVVSGSMTINVGNEIFYGLPLISLVCFVLAFGIGMILFISIIKENKMIR